MIKTYSHTHGILGIISLAQSINPEIGYYQEHFINDKFNFTVKVSNGTINMTLEDAQDYEARPSSVTFDRVEIVARTFKKPFKKGKSNEHYNYRTKQNIPRKPENCFMPGK